MLHRSAQSAAAYLIPGGDGVVLSWLDSLGELPGVVGTSNTGIDAGVVCSGQLLVVHGVLLIGVSTARRHVAADDGRAGLIHTRPPDSLAWASVEFAGESLYDEADGVVVFGPSDMSVEDWSDDAPKEQPPRELKLFYVGGAVAGVVLP